VQLSTPQSIAVDGLNDQIFIVNAGNQTISVYDLMSYGLIDMIPRTYLDGPVGAVVDEDNNQLFVVNSGSNTISVYQLDSHVFVKWISHSSLNNPKGITLDSTNQRIFVTNHSGASVSIFDSVTHGFISAIVDSHLNGPAGIAVDPESDQLFVVNQNSGSVAIFNWVTSQYLDSIIQHLNRPWGISLNTDVDKLFVSNLGDNTVSVYNLLTHEYSASITTNLNQPRGTALNAQTVLFARASAAAINGQLFVVNDGSNSVSVFDILPPYHFISSISNPPTMPGIVTANIVKNSNVFQTDLFANIRWTAPGNFQPKRYIVYRNQTVVARVSDTTFEFSDHGLKSKTRYTFSVVAEDDSNPPVAVLVGTTVVTTPK
jgi:DNA-binding beta-propeller fold protein YncE